MFCIIFIEIIIGLQSEVINLCPLYEYIIMSCGKRKRLTLAQKIEIIKFVEISEENIGVRVVAEKFNIGKTQVSDILKSKVYLLQTFVGQGSEKSKRKFPNSNGEIIDTVIFQWYLHARVNNLKISGPLLKEKALELASEVGLNDFKASNGWLQKFKERHQISYKNIHGNPASSVKQCVIIEWLSKVKELIDGYEECNIFNCDETGLFFRVLPKDTMTFINETCSEGNLSKERLTIMLCANMVGEFEKPLIIGKIKKYRCLKYINTDNLGIIWKSNTKAWMTRDIMTKWLLDFDYRMTQAKRKVILFLDNASSHTLLNNLQSVKLIFFPPYTSFCCPLDQGVIQKFKVLYRQCVIKHQLEIMENDTGLVTKINVLDAIHWIKFAINKIQKSTIRNCFIKSGILISHENTIIEDNLATSDLNALLIRFIGDDLVNYAELDNNLLTENQSLNLIKIMQELVDPQNSDEDEEDSEEDISFIISKDTA